MPLFSRSSDGYFWVFRDPFVQPLDHFALLRLFASRTGGEGAFEATVSGEEEVPAA